MSDQHFYKNGSLKCKKEPFGKLENSREKSKKGRGQFLKETKF